VGTVTQPVTHSLTVTYFLRCGVVVCIIRSSVVRRPSFVVGVVRCWVVVLSSSSSSLPSSSSSSSLKLSKSSSSSSSSSSSLVVGRCRCLSSFECRRCRRSSSLMQCCCPLFLVREREEISSVTRSRLPVCWCICSALRLCVGPFVRPFVRSSLYPKVLSVDCCVPRPVHKKTMDTYSSGWMCEMQCSRKDDAVWLAV